MSLLVFYKRVKKAITLLTIVLFVGCSEEYQIEQSVRSLAGSIASIYPYFVGGTIDGEPMESPDNSNADSYGIMYISKQFNNNLSLSFESTAPQTPIVGDILSVHTSLFAIQGEPADVQFDETVKITLVRSDNSVQEGTAIIKGWFKNITLIEMRTKTEPSHFELDGHITITCIDSHYSDFIHSLAITTIYRYPGTH